MRRPEGKLPPVTAISHPPIPADRAKRLAWNGAGLLSLGAGMPMVSPALAVPPTEPTCFGARVPAGRGK